MTADPRGLFEVTANGQTYRLHLGMSVLADLQGKHGQDVLSRLDAPPAAPPGWMPPLAIVVDLMLGALQRHHAEEADRFVVDDIIAENPQAFERLMAASFPDQAPKATSGNGRRPKRAA